MYKIAHKHIYVVSVKTVQTVICATAHLVLYKSIMTLREEFQSRDISEFLPLMGSDF